MAVEQRRYRSLQDSPFSLDAILTGSSDVAAGTSSTGDSSVPTSAHPTSPRASRTESVADSRDAVKDAYSSLVYSPPPISESQTRSNRSTSTASRNSNRLSLTLPIAPPNGFSSRPTPTAASMPPTPIDHSLVSSPTDPNDFIIAIAAQERRVLELREELGRAEDELRRLKKQWAASDAYKKRASNNRNIDPLRAMARVPDGQWGYDDNAADRFTSELERRKAILLAQSQGTPREHKRTVIRGGHTRTLSLLSPTRPINGEEDGRRSAELDSKPSPILSPAPLNKRATWAPRQSLPANGVNKIANDFKQGLWTFVEDLRQATVGDEGISGTTNRTSEMVSRLGRMDGDQDTIRASSAVTRGRIPFQPEPDSSAETPGRSSTGSFSDRFQHRRTASRPEPKEKKRFSWQPLTFDNFDDEDWSNWDSPNVKTARWSGSTVNGDIITAIPENEGTLRRKQSRSELRSPSPPTPSKLEELPQAILNRLTPLTPSNVKNATSNFIKEWEKSLSSPTEEPESLI